MSGVCYTPGCTRIPAGRRKICGACRRWVPAETWLALNGHFDAWAQPELADAGPFIHWSHERTLQLAALQAWERSPTARTDQPTLAHVVSLRADLGA